LAASWQQTWFTEQQRCDPSGHVAARSPLEQDGAQTPPMNPQLLPLQHCDPGRWQVVPQNNPSCPS
jgi:hypothetical protein